MIKALERSKGNVFGFEVSGEITVEDIRRVTDVLDKAIEKYGKINWLFVFKTIKYHSPRAFYEDIMWVMKHLKYFDRMAVVGDTMLGEVLAKVDALAFGEKYFDISQLEDAWRYVEEGAKS